MKVLGSSTTTPLQVNPDLSTAALSALVAVIVLLAAAGLGTAAMVVIGVLASTVGNQAIIDLHTRRLPLAISHRGAAAIVLVAALFSDLPTFGATLLGAATMAAIGKLLAMLAQGSLGRWDVHYCWPLGAALGFFSSPVEAVRAVLLAWAVTAAAAGLVIAVGLVRRRLTRRSTVPYGPFLTVGTVGSLLAAVAA